MAESDRQVEFGYSWLPYLVLGVVICAFLESVFYLELADKGPLMVAFIWAYSQAALVELVVPSAGPPTWALQAIAWFCFYVALSFGLWVLLGRSSSRAHAMGWRRALFGWVGAELVLAIVAAGALYAGIIEIE